jgi:hypothetical protein
VPKKGPPRSSTPVGCVDQRTLIYALVRDVAVVPIADSTTYDVSYPEFLGYFESCGPITNHHLIIAANFAYGWMPTILDFVNRDFERGVAYLESARAGNRLSFDELRALANIVNNSAVGVSKLLHFAAPAVYAIWDSNVAKYLGARIDTGDRGIEQYVAYNDCMRALSETSEAWDIVKKMSQKVRYDVSRIRALELVMFHAGKRGLSYLGDSIPSATLANTR